MGRAGTGVGFSGGAYGIEELQEAIEDVNYAHAVIDDVSPRQVAPCRPPFSCKINHGEMQGALGGGGWQCIQCNLIFF